MDGIMDFVRLQLKEYVMTSIVHKMKMFVDLFGCLVDDWRGDTPPSPSTTAGWIESLFVFSVTWGIASNMDTQARKKFDEWFRALMKGENEEFPKPKHIKFAKSQLPPERGLLHDFVFSTAQGSWTAWADMVSTAEIPKDAKAETLIIQTQMVVMQSYFLNLFIKNERPCMFIGPTGTGKSAVVNEELLKLPRRR